MFHLPKPEGPYPIGTRTVHLIDPSRQETHPHSRPGNREVVLQFWYPSATATGRHAMYREFKETKLRSTYQAVLPVDALQDSAIANGTFPVIFFNPAWNGFRNRSTFITQNLASLGFIVVGISHPYNSAFTELSDGYVAQSRDEPDLGEYSRAEPLSERLNLAKSELAIQVADDEFVLEQLTKLNETPDSPFYHHLEMDNVGAFGHSFGGSVSVELALQRSAREMRSRNGWVSLRPSRSDRHSQTAHDDPPSRSRFAAKCGKLSRRIDPRLGRDEAPGCRRFCPDFFPLWRLFGQH